jgi:hypothetical protein
LVKAISEIKSDIERPPVWPSHCLLSRTARFNEDTDNPRFSLVELVDVQERVSDILGLETDVMTRASLTQCSGGNSKRKHCRYFDMPRSCWFASLSRSRLSN